MIVPMKKAKIVVLKEDRERLLLSLQKYGEIMLIPQSEDHEILDTTTEENFIQRTEKSLRFIKNYQEKKGFFSDYKEVNYDEFVNVDPKRLTLLKQIEEAEEQISRLKSENELIKESIAVLKPWSLLDEKLSNLSSTKHARIHVGYIDRRSFEILENEVKNVGGEVNSFGLAPEGQTIVISLYYEDNDEIMEKVRNLGYLEATLPKSNATVSEIIEEKEKIILNNNEEIDQIKTELKQLSLSITELELLNDQMETIKNLKSSPITHTLETVYLEGWVRSDRIERFQSSISEATEIYDLELIDPEKDEVPPTAVKNNKFVSAFETITDMFAKPKINEVDPNPTMSFWYWIIFGMMMADVGYGIVMAIVFFGLIKLTRPKGNALKLMRVLLFASIPTVIWGVLFGSYFGKTLNPILLDPTLETMKMLILSLVIGALHIITGILVKAYTNFIRKDYFAILFDQLSWISVLVGIGLMFLPAYAKIGQIMALSGAIIIVLFAGRKSKNIFGRFGGGLYSLYGITGYMSDILSYSRILALSLSTAIIGYVMNLLASLLQASIVGFIFSIFVYLVGHTFNIVMGLLSAYVHDSRLQYIEFFNKFYEGGGYEFEPLSVKLKYIDHVNK